MGQKSLPYSGLLLQHLYHRFHDITTFAVNVIAWDLEKSIKFKSQAMYAFKVMCKYTSLSTLHLSYGYYKDLKHQKWPSVSLKVTSNHGTRWAIGHTRFPISLPLYLRLLPSLLWQCWLDGRKGIHCDKRTCLRKFLTNMKFTLSNFHYVINYVISCYISMDIFRRELTSPPHIASWQ